ncbi:MAG TPA: hypothetical protein VLL25_05735, partial [Acidimicrobiales bacterium]|nr:hypothetical protein [Acidimicrobiales bacterium]
MLTISLITLGSPEQLTGGYLYHRRMADFAPAYDAALEFVSFPTRPFPLPAAAGNRVLRQARRANVVVVDSLAAAFLAPWPLPHAVAAILHQPPGGIDNRAVRRGLQKRLDTTVYRRCQLLIFASRALVADASDRRTVVVPPGSDVSVVPAGPLPALRQGRQVAFLSVGNWIPRKGTLELLTAFARLPDNAATLHLVGRTDQDRRYAARVRCRLAQPDLADRVVVHGPVPPAEVARFYA